MASAGAGTGWMSPITPTPRVTTPTTRCRNWSTYRDYIIDSFNQDKPGDRFVREQLAGDILARERVEGDFRGVGRSPPDSRLVPAIWDRARSSCGTRTLGRCDRDDRRRLPGTDAALCAMPRPQVRPGRPDTTITHSTGCSPAMSSPWAGSEETHSKVFPADLELRPARGTGPGGIEAQGVSRTARRAGTDHSRHGEIAGWPRDRDARPS